ncbi:hypothetical protein NLJ89_g7889 [Agrocybe chaxingu]|uniref:Uncharacterized protein n=1 Tax=Agrocybe chaxingu TaxID=84603 RepID=A0A9W8JVG8_9AGAR|nr:hypothetical protein NLJ89_g7889 [Agrocybe chaxingu]
MHWPLFLLASLVLQSILCGGLVLPAAPTGEVLARRAITRSQTRAQYAPQLPRKPVVKQEILRGPKNARSPRTRIRSAKDSSKKARKTAAQNGSHYAGRGSTVVKQRLPASSTKEFAKTMKKKDADHILEHQVLVAALKAQRHDLEQLKSSTRKGIKNILNSNKNLVLVDKSINRSKGQVFRNALKNGKSVQNKKADRDEYIGTTLHLAKNTAKELDKELGGYRGNVHATLTKAIKNGGLAGPRSGHGKSRTRTRT